MVLLTKIGKGRQLGREYKYVAKCGNKEYKQYDCCCNQIDSQYQSSIFFPAIIKLEEKTFFPQYRVYQNMQSAEQGKSNRRYFYQYIECP